MNFNPTREEWLRMRDVVTSLGTTNYMSQTARKKYQIMCQMYGPRPNKIEMTNFDSKVGTKAVTMESNDNNNNLTQRDELARLKDRLPKLVPDSNDLNLKEEVARLKKRNEELVQKVANLRITIGDMTNPGSNGILDGIGKLKQENRELSEQVKSLQAANREITSVAVQKSSDPEFVGSLVRQNSELLKRVDNLKTTIGEMAFEKKGDVSNSDPETVPKLKQRLEEVREAYSTLKEEYDISRDALKGDLKVELMVKLRTEGSRKFINDFINAHKDVNNVFSPHEYIGDSHCTTEEKLQAKELRVVYERMEKETALRFFAENGHLIPPRILINVITWAGVTGDIDLAVLEAMNLDEKVIAKIEAKQKK